MVAGHRRQPAPTLLLAVLEKRVGLDLLGDDVFVIVGRGLDVSEAGADLGVAAAIRLVFPQPPTAAAHTPCSARWASPERSRCQQAARACVRRLRWAFTRCILPARNVPTDVAGIELVGVATPEEALERLAD